MQSAQEYAIISEYPRAIRSQLKSTFNDTSALLHGFQYFDSFAPESSSPSNCHKPKHTHSSHTYNNYLHFKHTMTSSCSRRETSSNILISPRHYTPSVPPPRRRHNQPRNLRRSLQILNLLEFRVPPQITSGDRSEAFHHSNRVQQVGYLL